LNYYESFGISSPSFNVKITQPYKNDTVAYKDKLLIIGVSKYNPSFECTVSLIVNNKKPYYLVTPKGNNGSNDFTKWEFVIDKNIQKAKLFEGSNKITAKNYCSKSKTSAFYSILFNISSSAMAVYAQDNGIQSKSPNQTMPVILNVLCCKNITEEENGQPHLQKKVSPITEIHSIESSPLQTPPPTDNHSFKNKKKTDNIAEEIQLKIRHLVSQHDDNLDFTLDDDVSSNGKNKKDDGNNEGTDDDLHKIKDAIKNALA
jgi:hypothetical protein